MDNAHLKQLGVAVTAGIVMMFLLAAGIWFFYAQDEWKRSAKTYRRAVQKYRDECRLIGEKTKWSDAYEEEKARMPLFETGKNTDTTWLQKMDELARKHHVNIAQRQGGKEVEAGEVLEMPIEVRSWEGALEPLVRFMHELENTDDGMFDVRAISFRPSSKKGYLKGSFTLTCAYMRDKE